MNIYIKEVIGWSYEDKVGDDNGVVNIEGYGDWRLVKIK